MGIDLEPYFLEVHRSNMAKFKDSPGRRDDELLIRAVEALRVGLGSPEHIADETEGGGVEEDPQLDGSSAPKAEARPLGSPPAASFPIPDRGLIRDVVDLFSGRTEVPDETLALCMLSTMSAVTGWARWLKWGESPEPCILYVMIIGKSATSKKSTGMRTVSSLWNEAGVDVGLTAQHASGRALVEAAMGGVAIFQVKPAKVPVDATPEQVLEIESDNMRLEQDKRERLDSPPAIVLEWDEFGTMLNVQGRWQEDTRVQLLQMYNGRHSGIHTSGRDGLNIPGGKTSICPTCDREAARLVVDSAGFPTCDSCEAVMERLELMDIDDWPGIGDTVNAQEWMQLCQRELGVA
jgi:hypothetical protein